jgi:putative transposase
LLKGPAIIEAGADHPIKYGGMGASDLKRLKELEAENAKLKKMYADLALEKEAIRSVLNRKP